MKTFEYLVQTLYSNELSLPVSLNNYGKNGWQIVSMQTFMYPLEPTKVWKYEVVFMKEVVT